MTKEYLSACKKLIEQKKYKEALLGLEFVLKINPTQDEAFYNLAICHSELKDWSKSLTAIVNALGHGGALFLYLEELINIIEKSQLNSYIKHLESPLKSSLKHPKLEFRAIPLFWKQVILKHPETLTNTKPIFNTLDTSLIQDESFLMLLQSGPITDYFLEDYLLSCRCHIRQEIIKNNDVLIYIPLLSALACQTLLNDGLYAVELKDQAYLKEIRKKTQFTEKELLILITYSSFEEALLLWEQHQSVIINSSSYTHKQLIKDFEFYSKVAACVNLGNIKQETSKKIQLFYMSNPYPKWKSVEIDNKTSNDAKNVLFAGCGTGQQVINYALNNPNATITAIDLSPTSLTYATLMTEKYGIQNITFKICDILEVAELKTSFDYIVCTGVLHHMESPFKGLISLNNTLADGGEMFLAFYSRAAREKLKDIYKDIKVFLDTDEKGITREGVTQWRSQLTNDNKQNKIYKISDFFYLNGLFDLLLHPQQAEYSAIELEELLNECNLTFKNMVLNIDGNPKLQKKIQKKRTSGRESLSFWHGIEQEFPDTFLGMFQFKCFKSNHTHTKQKEVY